MHELELAGCSVLVVGGGPTALTVVAELQRASAEITVAAEQVVASLEDLADRELLAWHRGPVTDSAIGAAALVVAATDDHGLDQDLAERCRRLGRPMHRSSRTATAAGPTRTGEVILIGGGPGDPDLLTVGGLAALRRADVILTDRLAPLASLAEARPDAEVIDVGKVPGGRTTRQETIDQLLVDRARAGQLVVRLKGGDGFIFGRGGEEWEACLAAGVPIKIIPGVSASTGVPGLAGVPLTHRDLVQGYTVVSGHVPPDHPGSTLDWAALARAGTTLVIMMGVATLPAITAELIKQGMPAELPAATIADGGLPSMRVVRGDLAGIAERAASAGIRPPAVTVIGAVAGLDFA